MSSTSINKLASMTPYWLAPARNFRTSARLHLQHFLFQSTLDNLLLSNQIRESLVNASTIRVADLGCGNGIWLTDLHRNFSRAVPNAALQLHGFDINPVNFPAAQFLPTSVVLNTLDVLKAPLPAELIGSFDVVHLRAFVSLIRNGDLTPALTTALSLLKPGGWIQWEETRPDNFMAQSPSPDVSKAACDSLIHILNEGGKSQGFNFSFLDSLDSHLTKHGFQGVQIRRIDKRPSDLKAWTEDYLLVWEELAELFPTLEQAPQAPLTREAFTTLFESAVRETEAGVVVHQGQIVFVTGQKPF